MALAAKRFRIERTNEADVPEDVSAERRHRELVGLIENVRKAVTGTAEQVTEVIGTDLRNQIEEARKIKVELDEIQDAIASTKKELATLHTVTYPRPGSVRGVSQALDPEPGRLDFAAEVDGIIDHWAPRLPGAPGEAWAALCGPMQRYAAEVAPEIAALQEFSLIHGDPVLTNIVVDGNRPVLIDWEWTQIGDPAQISHPDSSRWRPPS